MSAGRLRSAKLAMEMPHLKVGAQKWTLRLILVDWFELRLIV